MSRISVTLLSLCLGLLSGACATHDFWAARAWFASQVGISALPPVRALDGRVLLPLSLSAARPYGPRYLRRLESWVEQNAIVMRACITLPGPDRPELTDTALDLGPLEPGTYELLYQQPDGARVPLGSVSVPDR